MATVHAAAHRSGAAASPAHWLDQRRLRLYASVALGCYALYFGIWLLRACVLKRPGVFAPGGDFVVFWSAAKLALSSGAAAPYDFGALRQMELSAVPGLAIGDGVLPWLYPPASLWFVLPFGLLPYGLATFVFLAGAWPGTHGPCTARCPGVMRVWRRWRFRASSSCWLPDRTHCGWQAAPDSR